MVTGTNSPRTAEPISPGPDGEAGTVLMARDAVRRVRGTLSPYSGGRLLSDELIAERRLEAEES
jgi:hypothetical protein